MPINVAPPVASQTYSWQMSNTWRGRLDEIAQSVESAGFTGIEPEVCMTGRFEKREDLKQLLDAHNLHLAALTLVLHWNGPEETEAERTEADRVIHVLEAFPDARLALVQMPSDRWTNRKEAQRNLLQCLTAITARALDAGINPTFHPNSPDNSIVRLADDYHTVLPQLPSGLGWTPDTGHLARGGMVPAELIAEYRVLVNHIHLKDADVNGKWVPNGQGVVDLVGAVRLLADTGYQGWVVLEDESQQAAEFPHQAALSNGDYVRAKLAPLFTHSDSA